MAVWWWRSSDGNCMRSMKAHMYWTGSCPSHHSSFWWALLPDQLKIRILGFRFSLTNFWFLNDDFSGWALNIQCLRPQPNPSSHLLVLSKGVRDYKIRKKKVSKLISFVFFFKFSNICGKDLTTTHLAKDLFRKLKQKRAIIFTLFTKADGHMCLRAHMQGTHLHRL